jgi:hypothetical protein
MFNIIVSCVGTTFFSHQWDNLYHVHMIKFETQESKAKS